ncbi:MAG TPA: helix-turn-helix domain-containing protein [Pseudonocardiaceae bacterium]|jgi:sugar-specific transcriptional regulator TrmB/DNA-binding CsgD family transcriptional regulator|nr:helix-turn-helix domain-containing protein [Pseudonocardiaceae bacterium]
MALPDLGFSMLQEQVYRTLLANPTCGVRALAERFAVSETDVRDCLDGLVDLDVVRPEQTAPSGVAVRDPSVALAQLVERVQDDLFERRRRTADTRAEFDALIAAHRRGQGAPAPGATDTGIELLTDVEQVRERLDELSFFTSTSVYSVQPISRPSPDAAAAARPLEIRSLRRGVEMRVIYDNRIVADERRRAQLHEAAAGGVRIRLADGPLQRLIIMDERVAVVPVDPAGGDSGALIVRQPGLLDGFVRLFHLLWSGTTELVVGSGDEEDDLTEDDRALLALLAAGATDEAAARDFGISERQVRRRVAVLMRRLDARSRFEAGVLAVRRGWI